MKTVYVDWDTRAIADLIKPGELTPGWTISRINVPAKHRGKGLGSKLLKTICEDADYEKVELWLEPVPTGTLDYDQLVAWYERYGFAFGDFDYMIRPPVARE